MHARLVACWYIVQGRSARTVIRARKRDAAGFPHLIGEHPGPYFTSATCMSSLLSSPITLLMLLRRYEIGIENTAMYICYCFVNGMAWLERL